MKDSCVKYSASDLKRMNDGIKINIRISIILLVFSLLIATLLVFFISNYIEWCNGAWLMTYDFIEGGVETQPNYNPFSVTRLKFVTGFNDQLEYCGHYYIEIKY